MALAEPLSLPCQKISSIYMFYHDSYADYSKNAEANVILISSIQGKSFTFKTMKIKPSLKRTKVSQKKKKELIRVLKSAIN